MKNLIIDELKKFDKFEDVQALNRRFNLYIDPITSLLPPTTDIKEMLDELRLLYAFCSYEDKIIDGHKSDSEDAILALYFETLYLRRLSKYGESEIINFNNSLIEFIEYTKKECGNHLDFHYSIDTYTVKESPIFYHLDFMNKRLNYTYDKVFNFIKAYYLAVLLADDVEDVEEDVKNRKNTLITSFLREQSIDLNTVDSVSRIYWEYVDKFMSSWLTEQLHLYEEFNQNRMYRNIYSVYKNIRLKIE